MISKPLFKQSCKANAGIWAFVTGITCAMLAIIIFVLGNLNVDKIRKSMKDMFVRDVIEANIEDQSVTYYNLASTALTNYDSSYIKLKNLLTVQLDDTNKNTIIATYELLTQDNGKSDEEARAIINNGKSDEEAKAINAFLDYYLVEGDNYSDTKISEYVLNQIENEVYKQVLVENNEEVANSVRSMISVAIKSFVQSGSTSVTEYTTNYIPNLLMEIFHEQVFDYEGEELAIATYYSKDEIKSQSYESIVSFRAKIDIKEKQIRNEISMREDYSTLTPEEIELEVMTKLNEYKQELVNSESKTLLNELPQQVIDALSEIGDMDIYGLVIGSIFYRIAGLLLPMIFVIMTANNLIAGQVDSGSMAYVLSTPTKRRTVTITQMCYLVSSLLAMFGMMTITSIVSLAIVNSAEITISIGQIALLNLGGFITMFAISGICFLSSAWFNRSKQSMSVGGGLTMFFLVATILGLFGSKVIPSAIRIDAMKYFNYVSIISLFDAISILSQTTAFIWKFAILLLIGIVTYTISIVKFDKKDLPL